MILFSVLNAFLSDDIKSCHLVGMTRADRVVLGKFLDYVEQNNIDKSELVIICDTPLIEIDIIVKNIDPNLLKYLIIRAKPEEMLKIINLYQCIGRYWCHGNIIVFSGEEKDTASARTIKRTTPEDVFDVLIDVELKCERVDPKNINDILESCSEFMYFGEEVHDHKLTQCQVYSSAGYPIIGLVNEKSEVKGLFFRSDQAQLALLCHYTNRHDFITKFLTCPI